MDARKQQLQNELSRRQALQDELQRRSPLARGKKALAEDHNVADFIPKNLAAGALSGVMGAGQMIPDASSLLPESAQQYTPSGLGKQLASKITGQQDEGQKFDPYAAFGVENASFMTPQGAVQAIGEIGMPGVGAGKAAVKSVPFISEKLGASKTADQLIKTMMGEETTTQGLGKKIASYLKDKHESNYSQPKIMYDFMTDNLGKHDIFEAHNPLTSMAPDVKGELMHDLESLEVGELFELFKNKSNYRNAHNLQSELGTQVHEAETRYKQRTGSREEIQRIDRIRDRLNEVIKGFMKRKTDETGINYSDMNERASKLFEQNVGPYRANKKLRDLTVKGQTNTPNIHKVFESPSDIDNPVTGHKKRGAVNRILDEMPQDIKHAILAKVVGGAKHAKNPRKLVESLSNALGGEYGHLADESLVKQLSKMTEQLGTQDKLKKILYAGAGTAAAEELARRTIL